MINNCHMHALTAHVPDKIVTNDDIAEFVDTNDQWIVERTGISRRRRVNPGENASSIGLAAARTSLKEARLDARELTHIIGATCTPDYLAPSIACIIAGQLNAGPVMAFDISAACTGFIYGASICASILASQPDSRILFICSEALTRRLNWNDRTTCVLFGDAATACVFSAEKRNAMLQVRDVICQSDGSQKDLIIVGGGTLCQYNQNDPVDEKFFLSMQGRDTYKHAVRQMVTVCETLLKRNNLTVKDIDLFVPHQANIRIIEAVGSRMKIDPDKVFTNLQNYGNTSSASIPLALEEAYATGHVPQGALALVTAFGAGLTWGAALLQF